MLGLFQGKPNWGVVHLSLDELCRKWTRKDYRCVKSIQLCANMSFRDVFFSSQSLDRQVSGNEERF